MGVFTKQFNKFMRVPAYSINLCSVAGGKHHASGNFPGKSLLQ
jgi:hypothetical protein